jgi:plasmid stabilization system protein ParE
LNQAITLPRFVSRKTVRTIDLNKGLLQRAERLLEEIFAKLELLAEHPDMGRIVPEFGVKTLRELIHLPYRIVYQRDCTHAKVIRIWRSERILHLPEEN